MSLTPLELAMQTIANIFSQYKEDGRNPPTVTKERMQKLMKDQLPNLIQENNPGTSEERYRYDVELSLDEFQHLVAKVLRSAYR